MIKEILAQFFPFHKPLATKMLKIPIVKRKKKIIVANKIVPVSPTSERVLKDSVPKSTPAKKRIPTRTKREKFKVIKIAPINKIIEIIFTPIGAGFC